jgi:uncharacterized protein YggE
MNLFILTFLLSFSVLASKDIPQIQVQGNCEVKVIPDRGRITFLAENQSKDQKEAVKKTTEQINELKEAIEELKLKNLELNNSAYAVYPVREWEKEKVIEKGFRATLSLEVTTSEISRIGEAMMKASKVGITNVGELQTFLSLEKSQDEYLKCLDIAADDAKNKAVQIGKKLGFTIGNVISINEVPMTQPPTQIGAVMKAMSDEASVGSTQIEYSSQKFATNIQVTFSIQ